MNKQILIKSAFDKIIQFKIKSGLDKSSIAHFLRIQKDFISVCNQFQAKYISELTPEFIAVYRNDKLQKGNSPGGINSLLTQLSSLLLLFHQWGYLKDFDSKTWIKPLKFRKNSKSLKTISPKELDVLFRDQLLGGLFQWLYYSGCRIGVALQLRSQNIKNGLITYPPGKQEKVHVQPLTDDLKAVLNNHQRSSNLGFLFWLDKWGNPFDRTDRSKAETWINKYMKEILFDVFHNETLKTGGIKRKLIYKLELPSPHDFRATCATALADKGLDPLAITTFIGWSNVKTFFDHYYRKRPETLEIPSLNNELNKSNVVNFS